MKERKYTTYLNEECDTNEDVKEKIKEHGQPLKIFYEKDGLAAALVYEDKVVCTGFDGEEYPLDIVLDSQEA